VLAPVARTNSALDVLTATSSVDSGPLRAGEAGCDGPTERSCFDHVPPRAAEPDDRLRSTLLTFASQVRLFPVGRTPPVAVPFAAVGLRGESRLACRTRGLVRARQADPSDLRLLRDLERVVDVDPEIAHRVLDLGMAEQQLHRPQVLGLSVDQRRLRSTNRMGTVLGPVEPRQLSAGPCGRAPPPTRPMLTRTVQPPQAPLLRAAPRAGFPARDRSTLP
jgi:hypothetical protein